MRPAFPSTPIAALALALAWSLPWLAAADSTASLKDKEDLWSLRPLRFEMPAELSDPWCQNPIDAFVLQGLKRAGLHPSPAADRRSLLRRMSHGLTGLPPSPEEVAALTRDNTPRAIAKQVDRLLGKPQHGQHWARHWLDLMRYSDSKGYVYAREERQFVHAWAYRDWVVDAFNSDMPYTRFVQLQLAADQIEPAGSPHLAAMGFLTLGRRFLGVSHDIIDDRIDVSMQTLQGLTVSCARCHDHQFDPISSRDYYALYAVFASSAEDLVAATNQALPPALQAELTKRQQALRSALQDERDKQAQRVRSRLRDHLMAQLELEKYPEESFTQIIGEADINPVFVRRWQRFIEQAIQRRDPRFYYWQREVLRQGGVAAKSGNALLDEAFSKPVASAAQAVQRHAEVFENIEAQWTKLKAQQPRASALPDADAESLRQLLHGPHSPCVVPQEHLTNIEWFFPTGVVTRLWKLQGELDRFLMANPTAVHATVLRDRAQAVGARVFKRGNPLTPGEEVTRHFPQVLAKQRVFTKGSGRLEMSQEIASPHNPLTARVIVNRLWQHHFGRGLVDTPSDFGHRASPPSHPQLLDWLAQQLIREGWSLKAVHRLILQSATYQQSSQSAQPKAMELDADNRLLWRFSPQRLSFEQLHDSWLQAASGLDLRLGGPPQSLFSGPRRQLYSNMDRQHVPSVLRVFDVANPDLSIATRSNTTVAQQALFAINHPFVAKQADALSRGLKGNDTQRLEQLYQCLLQRPPTQRERDLALTYLTTEAAAQKGGPKSAAPWQRLCQTLMLSNELLFVD